MKTASVALLKQNLSSYLRQVEMGNEVAVTSHKRRIARLIPDSDEKLNIRTASLPVSALSSIDRIDTTSLSSTSMLTEDRRRR